MRFIFLRENSKSSLELNLADRSFRIAAAFAVFLITMSIVFAVVWLTQIINASVEQRAQVMVAEELQTIRQSLVEQELQTQREYDLLMKSVADMKARMLRLDAVGEQAVKVAKLDPAEFNFGQAPAVGGPLQVSAMSDENGFLFDQQKSDSLQRIEAMIDSLDQSLNHAERQHAMLSLFLYDRNIAEQVSPSGRPVRRGWLSSNYGYRSDPFTGKRAWHNGVDYASKAGEDVLSVGAGVVTSVDRRSGYGITVEVSHGNGVVTRYAHLAESLVSIGDSVLKGQTIAIVGSTGRSTGPHVHLEVIVDNKTVNPRTYLRSARI